MDFPKKNLVDLVDRTMEVEGAKHSVARSNIPVLTCAFLAALTTGGTVYAFGFYGAALKKALELSQSQLDTISSAYFCAGLLSWIPGLVVDKYGPRFALSYGGVLGAASLMAYWGVAREFVELPRSLLIPTLCTLGVLICMTNSLVTGSVYKIIVGTCGSNTRGSAVGVAKGYVGVGSGTYACIFQSLRGESTSDLDFLPMAAFFAICAGTVPALVLIPSKEDMTYNVAHDRLTPLHLRYVYIGLIGLGILVVGTSLVTLFPSEDPINDGDRISSSGPQYGIALLLMSFWYGPILRLLYIPTCGMEAVDATEEQALVVSSHLQRAKRYPDDPTWILPDGPPSQLPDIEEVGHNLLEMLMTAPAWLFAWITIFLVGAGTIMTNNMGQMVEALHFPDEVTPASLAIFSVAQSASRVITGTISDKALRWNMRFIGFRKGVPRPMFLISASLASVAAHLLLAVASSKIPFVIGVAMAGGAFGMIWPLMVLIVGEVFGRANVGANYMFFDGISAALGTLFLSKFVSQAVYESHIDLSDNKSDGRTCYGEECFRASHLIIAALAMSCVLASVGMVRLTRRGYDRRASYESQRSSYESIEQRK